MIGAERLPTSIAVELAAAGTEQLAAIAVGARMHFGDNAADAIFVVLERQALEKGFAIGAGSGSESGSHSQIVCLSKRIVKHAEGPTQTVERYTMVSNRMKAKGKNPNAAALGRLGGKASMQARSADEREEFARLGGLAGGKARAKKLTKSERIAIAKKAAEARWGKKTN